MGCTIELTSITYAIKARDLLRKNNVKARIEKSSGKGRPGCAYSLAVDDCDKANRILEESGMRIHDIS